MISFIQFAPARRRAFMILVMLALTEFDAGDTSFDVQEVELSDALASFSSEEEIET
jgi:hypothetical protein